MDEIKEYGQTDLNNNSRHKKIHLLNILTRFFIFLFDHSDDLKNNLPHIMPT